MNEEELTGVLKRLERGEIKAAQALNEIKFLPFADAGFAKIDHHRELRTGFPEVVYCQGKTPEQVARIMAGLREETDSTLLATRATETMWEAVKERLPEAIYSAEARLVVAKKKGEPAYGQVTVVAAGTADIPVAEEAALTCAALGSRVGRIFDVGAAGIHRLLAHREELGRARVVIAVAGMEGALPGFVASLVEAPVIAVPTSIGYGASFGGLAALLTMVNACPPGLAVVNIDNGFGAGYLGNLVNRLGQTTAEPVDSARGDSG